MGLSGTVPLSVQAVNIHCLQAGFRIAREVRAVIIAREGLGARVVLQFRSGVVSIPLQVGASNSTDAVTMNELRQWNEIYGEGGSRRSEQPSYFM